MKNNTSKKIKDIAFKSHLENDGSEYKPQPINWKKTSLIFLIIASILTGGVLIWLFAFKGKDYLDYKKISKETYINMMVDPDEDWVKEQSFNNDKLKTEAVNLTKTIKEIYEKEGGISYKLKTENKVNKYLYKDNRDSNPLVISSNDYLWQFIDNTLKKDIETTASGIYSYELTWQFIVRIIDNNISAIGFLDNYDPDNPPADQPYHWLDGSYTKNMKGR